MNVRLDYHEYDNEHTGIFSTNSDILRIIQLSKLRNITPEQQYNLQEHTQDVSLRDLLICYNEINAYKKEYNLIDFTDMIVNFVKSYVSPKFDFVFLD